MKWFPVGDIDWPLSSWGYGLACLAGLWHWTIVRNLWMGSARDVHQHVRILLHLAHFGIRRHARYQPWPPVPESVCAQQDAYEDVEENDDGVCCYV